jgi:hypothetical protein
MSFSRGFLRAATTVVMMLAVSPVSSFAQSASGPIQQAAEAAVQSAPHSSTRSDLSPRGALLPMYMGFAALQMLDAHSTVYAVNRGAVESNPIVRGLANRPPALIAAKMTVAFSTIIAAEHLRRRNKTAAILTMAAMNSAYAAIVVHNYRAGR